MEQRECVTYLRLGSNGGLNISRHVERVWRGVEVQGRIGLVSYYLPTPLYRNPKGYHHIRTFEIGRDLANEDSAQCPAY